jgi:branched-subunit amino acid ABC-type transport system permease component
VASIIALLSAYVYNLRFWLSALYGLLAGFLLWGLAAFYIDIENHQILSSKIGEMFGGINSITLIMITGLVGGFLTALGSMTGSSIRALFATNKEKD